jgi:hypothetical protein
MVLDGGNMEGFDPDKTLEEGQLQWVINNETGERVLVDNINNKIIGRWKTEKICPLCGKEK